RSDEICVKKKEARLASINGTTNLREIEAMPNVKASCVQERRAQLDSCVQHRLLLGFSKGEENKLSQERGRWLQLLSSNGALVL
ncbi:unnamed protein product, partial [Urochloa humidicola]